MFYRLVKMSSSWYAKEIYSVRDDADAIELFASEGNPVLIVDDLEGAADFLGIDVKDIEVVED